MAEETAARGTLGMTAEELQALLEELLQEEAAEAAARNGTSVTQELASPGFAAVRASSSYAVHLIAANNVFLARHLLDLGVLPSQSASSAGTETAGREAE